MTIIDQLNILSDDQAITATAQSTNVIAIVNATSLKGSAVAPSLTGGVPIPFTLKVSKTFTGTGTIKIDLITSDAVSATDALTTPATIPLLAATTATNLTAGLRIKQGTLDFPMKKYVAIQYTVTGTVGAGTFFGGLFQDQTST